MFLANLLQEIDNPCTTLEESVQYETEKALMSNHVYNWETAKYGKISWCLDSVDINCLKFFETKFRAIFYDDALKLELDFSSEPTLSSQHVDKEEDLTGDDLKQYEADIEAMNLILISIPNDIYNPVDACQNARDMWNRVKRLMHGTKLSEADRESRFVNEFDKFTAEPGDSLSFMEELEELSANICMMARIQKADSASKDGPSYDSAFISQVWIFLLELVFTLPRELRTSLGVPSNFDQWDPTSLQPFNFSVIVQIDLDETLKQNEILKDQLLEATLTHDVERCVFMCLDSKNNNLNDEIEKAKRESIEIQENLLKRIKILENDFQGCQAQSIDFKLELKHQKEQKDCEHSLKNLCENSWISKMEKLENENVSLEFQVQSLIKECENVKLEYQKLFDSIKKTRTHSQREVNELIKNVNQKTYAYGDVRSQNQDLLITI
ncbi:hypothetical protein Tco_1578085 [Tanacetum coccineum]